MNFLLSLVVFYSSLGMASTLREQLEKQASGGKLPAEKRAIMEKATADLKKSRIAETSLKVGEQIPDFSLPNARGTKVAIADLLKNGPLVLTFYRGAWCPYCNLQLRAYQKNLPQIRATGASLVAISPDKAEKSYELTMRDKLEFEVLTDNENKIAKKFGLVFQVPSEIKKLYLEFGIDLDKSQGNADWRLPVPATYVVGRDRKILWAFVDSDYRLRAEPDDFLAVLRGLKP